MATLQDLINETQRRIDPVPRDIVVTLSSSVAAGATSLPYTDTSAGGVNIGVALPGTVVAVDLELFLVTGPAAAGALPVSPGYRGSTQASHTASTLIHLKPRYSDFDILTAINHDLDDLCSTENGLYHLGSLEITYNPTIVAYDLTDINTGNPISGLIDIIAIRGKWPYPDRKYRAVPSTSWELIPAMSIDPNFPSGYSLVLNDSRAMFPGMPINVIYKQQFVHLTNYTDNVQTVANLPQTCNDLPPLGAMLQLIAPREIQRNTLGAQPDGRLATEVPPGAVMNSVSGVLRQRQMRINSESANLRTRYESHMRRR